MISVSANNRPLWGVVVLVSHNLIAFFLRIAIIGTKNVALMVPIMYNSICRKQKGLWQNAKSNGFHPI